MRIIDGFILAKEIRKLNSSNRDIGIIGITAMEVEDVLEVAKEAGMDFIFKKPIELSEVSEVIAELLAA